MTTSFAAPSIKAHEQPAQAFDVRELSALPVLLIFRHRFGENYLSPSSLWKGTLAITVPLWLAYGTSVAEGSNPRSFQLALTCGLISLAAVTVLGARRILLALLFFPTLVLLARFSYWRWPSLIVADDFTSQSTRQTFLGVILGMLLLATLHMIAARRHEAPHSFSAGRSWLSVLSRQGGALSDGWLAQLVLEPLLTAAVGAVLWLVFRNWFGVYLLFASMMMFDSSAQRYRNAQLTLKTAVSDAQHVRNRTVPTMSSTGPPSATAQRSPLPTNEPFVARKAGRP